MYPELYLDVKESLVAESAKCGGLRLAEARRVVKIDVNKTRKLYDFFMAQQAANSIDHPEFRAAFSTGWAN